MLILLPVASSDFVNLLYLAVKNVKVKNVKQLRMVEGVMKITTAEGKLSK